MAIICDIETVPGSPELLEKMMPEEIKSPRMPDELENPEEPDWSEKCPKYASTKDEDQRAAKRQDWIAVNRQKWQAKQAAAVEKWRLGMFEAKAKFVRDAALDARLGHAKLIGLRSTATGARTVFAWEPDPAQAEKLRGWVQTLKGTFYGAPFAFCGYREERVMLEAFFEFFKREMSPPTDPQQCITYYGNTFDFPFLYRRAWICGLRQRPLFTRGKYFDETRMVDLDEIWKMGDRGETSGGLDRLSMVLGGNPKTSDGATFYRWYAEDPVEGVHYLINDVAQTEAAAWKMGAIQ